MIDLTKYVRIEPMKLIKALSRIFDSVSFKIQDLLALGTIDKVHWCIYVVTPSTLHNVEVLVNQDLVAYPRDKNLFINLPCDIDDNTFIVFTDAQLEDIRSEIKQFSFVNGDMSISNTIDSLDYLELDLVDF